MQSRRLCHLAPATALRYKQPQCPLGCSWACRLKRSSSARILEASDMIEQTLEYHGVDPSENSGTTAEAHWQIIVSMPLECGHIWACRAELIGLHGRASAALWHDRTDAGISLNGRREPGCGARSPRALRSRSFRNQEQ